MDVHLRVGLREENALVKASVEIEHNTLTSSGWGSLSIEFADEEGRKFGAEKEDVFLSSGIAIAELDLAVDALRLWWPNGSGSQHRYDVEINLESEDGSASKHLKWGMRTVQLNNRPGRFGAIINGKPIFLKGGNWIPPDSLYGRVTPDKVISLLEEAAEANFNCLRIWGGGRFEMDEFYEACDRHGIFVWQDFMSACAPLPAHQEWFRREFMKEADYQIRRLRNRACLLLWCGNNEVGSCYSWMPEFDEHKDPAWRIYHRDLPRLLKQLDPDIPYWPTSPYGGAENVNARDVGDDHHWVVMRAEEEYWSNPQYWDESERPIFNSEYGYGGPCSLETTREYTDTDSPDLFSEVGHQHTNTFYDIPRVNHGIREHYRDPEGLSLEDYILLGGLVQGLNLGYSLESLRANEQTMGGIFWMYNDTWGENGWTIIDYYLRRKISFYNVRRCLAPTRLVLRKGGQAFGGKLGEIVLIVLNDSPDPLGGEVEMGYVSFDGNEKELDVLELEVPGRSRTVAGTWEIPDGERARNGTVAAIPRGIPDLLPVTWYHGRYRELNFPGATIEVVGSEQKGDHLEIRVRSDVYAHAVHFQIPSEYRLSDHYFDLLPGEQRKVTIYGGRDLDPDVLSPRSTLPERGEAEV